MAQERARPDPEVKRRPWRGGGASGGARRNGPPGGCGGVGRPRGPGKRGPAGGSFLLLSPPEASGGAEAARLLPSAPAETPPALQDYKFTLVTIMRLLWLRWGSRAVLQNNSAQYYREAEDLYSSSNLDVAKDFGCHHLRSSDQSVFQNLK